MHNILTGNGTRSVYTKNENSGYLAELFSTVTADAIAILSRIHLVRALGVVGLVSLIFTPWVQFTATLEYYCVEIRKHWWRALTVSPFMVAMLVFLYSFAMIN